MTDKESHESSALKEHLYGEREERNTAIAFQTTLIIFTLWCMHIVWFFIPSFQGELEHLIQTEIGNEMIPTQMGIFVVIWSVLFGALLLISLIHSVFHSLGLRTYRKNRNISWTKTIKNYEEYDRKGCFEYLFSRVVVQVALIISILTSLPISIGDELKICGLYLSLFSLLVMYGTNYFQLKKERRDALIKEGPIEDVFKEKNQHLLHFKDEIEAIMCEIEKLKKDNTNSDAEDQYVVERMVKEEIPKLLLAYDKLDEEGKRNYTKHFAKTLSKMHDFVKKLNEIQRKEDERAAEKLLEMLDERY